MKYILFTLLTFLSFNNYAIGQEIYPLPFAPDIEAQYGYIDENFEAVGFSLEDVSRLTKMSLG